MRKRLMFIFGTRPEAIKMAPVIKVFRNDKKYEVLVCVTAQHRRMLDEVLTLFNISTDYDLNIMVENQTLYHVTIEVLKRLSEILKKVKPDLIFVHGDTTTTFASSLCGYYERIPVAHIEAGLRSYKKYLPFPEEINRVFVDEIAEILFPPTQFAKQNLRHLRSEGVKIFVTGNTVIDAVKFVAENCDKYVSQEIISLRQKLNDKKIILMTAHRRENFGTPMKNIFNAVKVISEKFDNIGILYPVHPNPNVSIPAKEILSSKKNVFLLTPLNYYDFVYLMKNSYLILTDSGGVQEESTALKVPTLVMREVTERPEGVKSGSLDLVGSNSEKIVKKVTQLLTDEKIYLKEH